MNTNEIRKKYLDFFKAKQHTMVSSDSLVPQNDPTLLFTGAGMNQFKDYFLGVKKDLKRATSSQKCLRTGDLDEVGKTAYHHSFFEMLGNFSFGDYFKEGAIQMAWEFLTSELKMDPKRLRISVHNSDEEAFNIWKNTIKIRPDWIYKLGDKDNFWPSNAPTDGPNGPCGPCSEIYYDQNPTQGDGGDLEQTFTDTEGTHKRFAEIWNLVFTQYDRQDGGKLISLAQKNIDTGMGLERLACMVQNKKSNYEIDILNPINAAVKKELNLSQVKDQNRVHAITDHVRAAVFSIADGVIPSNEGRGYVIRKIIRRALWHAHQLIGKDQELKSFLYKIAPVVVQMMKDQYPELKDVQESVISTLKSEEERFLETLETGLRILNDRIDELAKQNGKTLLGKVMFELYDTYGFPDELTRDIAIDRGLKINQQEFEELMEAQRKRAKDSTKMSGSIFVASDFERKLNTLSHTKFLGYETLESPAKILFFETAEDKSILVLDQSPFYGESGGQVGDQGSIESKSFKAQVLDTIKKDHYMIHAVKLLSGAPKVGDQVNAKVDKNRREQAMRNHTATHLLHAALRMTLGPQTRQLGSLVAPEKLRFDYSASQALTPEQIQKIEDLVNAQILEDIDVSKKEMSLDEAKKEGALAFFGEKYGSRVRVVDVPGFSKEFCGGTHCSRTGQIGSFVIISDSSIASGTRRIEALSGEGAINYLRTLRQQIGQLSLNLKTTPDKLNERVSKLQDSLKKLEKEQEKGFSSGGTTPQHETEKKLGEYRLLAQSFKELRLDNLRKISDDIRSSGKKTVFFLGAEEGEKISFLLGVSADLKAALDIRELGKQVAQIFSGSCGGRQDLVQGGAPNDGQFAAKWNDMVTAIQDFLKAKA